MNSWMFMLSLVEHEKKALQPEGQISPAGMNPERFGHNMYSHFIIYIICEM